jgi:glutamate synthase (NADPH/NADH) large chain
MNEIERGKILTKFVKPAAQGLYNPANEHDACGVGFVAHIKGEKSHNIVEQGLQVLDNLTHRGATGFDPLLGDGAGILVQIPDEFFRNKTDLAFELPPVGAYGIGMVFLPQEESIRLEIQKAIEGLTEDEGQAVLGWRDVPVDSSGISQTARDVEPVIRQIFIRRGPGCQSVQDFERKLFVIRKLAERQVKTLKEVGAGGFYLSSMSARTLVYKGMLLASQVGDYYLDLMDIRFTSALALVHQRFSTNTFPSWELSHPFRMIGHNGEFNTLRGNLNWMKARERALSSPIIGDDLEKLWPLIDEAQSDSACFDNALELLVLSGYSVAQAMMLLIPEAWSGNSLMSADRKNFFEYHAPILEPWDGPAAVAFTDGVQIGATLDRNGLRPARYLVTKDDLVVMASEVGVLPIEEKNIAHKWRLEPGKMLLIDTIQGRIIGDEEVKETLIAARDYSKLLKQSRMVLSELSSVKNANASREVSELLDLQQSFGFTQEDIKFILMPMAKSGQEGTGSMGNDSPLAVLSDKNKSIYSYFKQLFAQVTNPPVDPIREEIVMSLISYVGPKPNLLGVDYETVFKRLELSQPILDFEDYDSLVNISKLSQGAFDSEIIDITFPVDEGPSGLERALSTIAKRAERAVQNGKTILILCDKGVDSARAAIPALLATSSVHHHLVRNGLRTKTGLVVSTGSAREVHHFALLAGYGAEAVHPWLTMETLAAVTAGSNQEIVTHQKNFIKAVGKGLNKVMSKMGICTYQSYCGAQIFEAIGLNTNFVHRFFTGTSSNVEGIGLEEIAVETINEHSRGFSEKDPTLVAALDAGGEYAYRTRGEAHMWTPESVATLQRATRTNEYSTYKQYAEMINEQNRRHMTLRGLFQITPLSNAIPIDQVEPWTAIVTRFATGAMSLGSISTEAHSTLAIAMNRIGGKSNTGEGGEDPGRFKPVSSDTSTKKLLGDVVISDVQLKKGDTLRSKIKQVASGRFGVTAEYLANADQIQIKVSQGAKPGEGGQLPGHKVSQYIAKLRFSVPGVGLISPPPHHDIYSIEDLAQLIHDLKNANPKAAVSVKLVSEIGVGTVAAGVSKAKSDHVVIAGYDGGTGASPLSSIKHAGAPWELGLSETQQTLVLNQLRGRIVVQVDGQMKTGRDVIIGALLGADEFGFATAPLVVEGCIMMRKCHLNTCPVGIATQDPILREKFSGKPEHVINYFHFVAQEMREIMASMGVRSLNEIIGRSDLLDMREGVDHWKAKGLDFSKIFYRPKMSDEVARRHCEQQDHGLDKGLDNTLIEQSKPALENQKAVQINSKVISANRSVGAMLSNQVVTRYGHAGLPDDTVTVNLEGSAGQSFGVFLAHGITFNLKGDANDYVGKGLSGGRIAIYPSSDFSGPSNKNIVIGNTVLYGAVEGEAYFSGVAGERFAVRNSGATAVVEGVGDHCCEYMTGGTVVVLGDTGRNFAAGMSGGVAYVYDPKGHFNLRCNPSMVDLEPVLPTEEQPNENLHCDKSDEELLKQLVSEHERRTGSIIAREILAQWGEARGRFVKVFPHEYQRALTELSQSNKSEREAA